ncbi:MAG: hypothetical protein QXP51_04750 [Candidatus Hadarchaeales archaeon]
MNQPCDHYERCLQVFKRLEVSVETLQKNIEFLNTEVKELRELLLGINGLKGVVYKVNIMWYAVWAVICVLPILASLFLLK